jgi:hypothetical protein
MKKIMSILTIFVVGILFLSGVGLASVINNYNITIDKKTKDNHPPNAPFITGPSSIKRGTYEYTFNSTDPDGDNISYLIDWGDGSGEGGIGPYNSGEEIKLNHTWFYVGCYTVQAKAKDIHGLEGPIGVLIVTIIPKSLTINSVFLQFINRFMVNNQL